MATRKLEFSLLALFDGSAAMRGLKGFSRDVSSAIQGMTRQAGLFGGFAGIGGGGIFGRMLGMRPGGAGGVLSQITQSAAGLAMAPVRILGGFATLIPGIGGILGGAVATAANVLQGLIGIVANIVGAIVNLAISAVRTVLSILEGTISLAGRILGKLVKIGLGVGAALGAAIVLGVRRNFEEMQMRRLLEVQFTKPVSQAIWAEIERVHDFGGSIKELFDVVRQLGRAFREPQRYLQLMVDTATATGASMSEIADIMIRFQTGGPEWRVGMMLQRMGFTKADIERIKTVTDLVGALQRRFGGLAQEVDKLDPLGNIWRESKDGVRDVTSSLAEALLPHLTALVNWLKAIRDSEGFKRLRDWIAKAGDAVATFLHEKLAALWDWLTTRDWSLAWKGLLDLPQRLISEVFPKIRDLFAVKGPGGWEAGSLVKTFLVAIQIIKTYALQAVNEIFEHFGERLGGVMSVIAQGLRSQAQAMLETAVAPSRRPGIPGLYEGPQFLDPTKYPQYKAAMALVLAADAAEEMHAALSRGRKAAPGRIEDIEAERAKDFQQLGAEARALTQDLGELGAAVGGVIRETVPERPGAREEAGVRRGEAARERAAAAPETEWLKRRIASGEQVATALQKAGYAEAAAKKQAEVEALRMTLDHLLERIIQQEAADQAQMHAMRKDLDRHERALNRLGTARA